VKLASFRIAFAVSGTVLWAVMAQFAGLDDLPRPSEVLNRIIEWITSGLIGPHLLATARSAGLGLAVGGAAGILLPLSLQPMPRVMSALHPYIAVSAGLPKYALMPLLILWVGIDDGPTLCLVALLAFYPVYFGTVDGLRAIDDRLVLVMRVLGAGERSATWIVMWHTALPFLSAALRIAIPRAVSGAIVGELFVGNQGVGHLIDNSRQNLDAVGLVAGVFVVMSLVAAASVLFGRIDPTAGSRSGTHVRTAVSA
jgi:NitT/TauT family transport system permease protein